MAALPPPFACCRAVACSRGLGSSVLCCPCCRCRAMRGRHPARRVAADNPVRHPASLTGPAPSGPSHPDRQTRPLSLSLSPPPGPPGPDQPPGQLHPTRTTLGFPAPSIRALSRGPTAHCSLQTCPPLPPPAASRVSVAAPAPPRRRQRHPAANRHQATRPTMTMTMTMMHLCVR